MDSMKIILRDEFIKLGQALKAAGLVETGADAKAVILDGEVQVNGETCLQRGKKLYDGDSFVFENTVVNIIK